MRVIHGKGQATSSIERALGNRICIVEDRRRTFFVRLMNSSCVLSVWQRGSPLRMTGEYYLLDVFAKLAKVFLYKLWLCWQAVFM